MILALAPIAIAVAALATFTVLVPDVRGWPVPAATFLALGVATSIAGRILPGFTASLGSLRWTMLAVALVAMSATVIAVVASALLITLSPKEYGTVLAFLAFGAALGLVLEVMVAQRLASDLGRLRQTARHIGERDFSARAEVDRGDEIGQAARALDAMATQLETVEQERTRARASRQAFLAAIGHDLKTPLAALQAAVEAVEDGVVADRARYFDAIGRNIDVMRDLVDDLFLLARIEAGALEFSRVELDLTELVDEVIEGLSPVARQRDVALQFEPRGRVVIRGGPAELSRALRNVLENAIRFSPPSSEVRVEVVEDGGALVSVTDQGPGFPEEIQSRVFEPYVRADPEARGTGLGLAIAKGVVEAHDGRIWIEPRRGGRVSFRLPLLARSSS